MKLKVLSISFRMLGIVGAMYVFYTDGRANAGYAVIPIFISVVFQRWSGMNLKKSNS